MQNKAFGIPYIGQVGKQLQAVYEFLAGFETTFNPENHHAAKTFFKTRIAHGMLTAGFISAIIGTRLPGPGSIYMGQELRFLAPVRFGDTITARVEVIEKDSDKGRVRMKTTCVNQAGKEVLAGEALVSAPRPPKALDVPTFV